MICNHHQWFVVAHFFKEVTTPRADRSIILISDFPDCCSASMHRFFGYNQPYDRSLNMFEPSYRRLESLACEEKITELTQIIWSSLFVMKET